MAAISNGNRGRAADSLLSLRHSIIAAEPYVLSEDSKPETSTIDLAIAKYVYFGKAEQQILFALDSPTRFLSSGKPVSLRSVVFAWQKKDVAIPDYIAAVQKLNADLLGPNGAGDSVQNLVFIEKLDLVTWLEGAADDSEHIAGLPEELAIAAGVQASVSAGAAAIGGVGPGAAVGSAQGALIASGGVRSTKVLDPRLAEIYSKERKMGDHNSVLRGIKPTVSLYMSS